ncbi:hypothetical protein HY090_00375 [Candidatus Kaiserbacteria bacterium]|nr:hypothetical protein [Candidatus Kaiserbacteria bacterium]
MLKTAPHTRILHHLKKPHSLLAIGLALFAAAALFVFVLPSQLHFEALADAMPFKPKPVLDKVAYDLKMLAIANYPPTPPAATSTPSTSSGQVATSTPPVHHPWPVKGLPYPNAGALLPFNRIVTYYGNFYSKGMGVLGQYPEEEAITKLKSEVAAWEAVDPATPVIPAIDYIVVTAQGSAGADKKYRLRMPDDQVDKALEMANKLKGIVVLDVQVGLSNLPTELPIYEKYFKMPNVHLAIDPEFAMHGGTPPGRIIGSFDAKDINYAANYLANLVRGNNLPPKILIVHRFTEEMVTNYKNIMPLPEVQIVMDMDGWGFAAKKINTYNTVIFSEPVQLTGFKLFYKNDLLPPSTRMLTDAEILDLRPQPMFIQYQ